MKLYRNEKHGFEIEIPEAWAPAPPVPLEFLGLVPPIPKGIEKDVFQIGCYDEAFNFEISPLFPEPLLSDTEREFTLYARTMGFHDLVFGRIWAGGKEHVCAHYYINDNMGRRWNKKYMIVFGGIEYAITGTCNDPGFFSRREQDWNQIIESFHLLAPVDESLNATDRAERARIQRRQVIDQRFEMREIAGDQYAAGYEMVIVGQYAEARKHLEACLNENPDHVLAHKEMAVVLKKIGQPKNALRHRREVKRLAPDDLINRANLVDLLAACGKRGEALREAREVLSHLPGEPTFQKLEENIRRFRYTDYALIFFSALAFMLLGVIGLWTGTLGLKNVWIPGVTQLVAAFMVYYCGPWVGINRAGSALIAAGLFVLFMLKAL